MWTVSVTPLNGTNYPSWKVQCGMVLVREGLWGIVAGTEEPPDPAADAGRYAKYVARKDRALATIVLAVDPTLLYLLGDPHPYGTSCLDNSRKGLGRTN